MCQSVALRILVATVDGDLSAIDLVRTSTDPDEWADFFEHCAGCHENGITMGTDWAEMRIAENAWFRLATAAKRAAFRFRVHGGTHAD